MVERVNHWIDEQGIQRHLVLKFSLDVPKGWTVDSSDDSLVLEVKISRQFSLQVTVGGAAEQSSSVGDLRLAERLLTGKGDCRERSGKHVEKEVTHSGRDN